MSRTQNGSGNHRTKGTVKRWGNTNSQVEGQNGGRLGQMQDKGYGRMQGLDKNKMDTEKKTPRKEELKIWEVGWSEEDGMV